MRIYTIRISILDMSIAKWGALNKMLPGQKTIAVSAKEFLEKVGLPGAQSAWCNEEETEFFDKIYELERSKRRDVT